MPITTRVQGSLILVTLQGRITDQDILANAEEVRSLEAYRSNSPILCDCSQLGENDYRVTGAALYRVREITAHDLNRVAVVVQDPFAFGMIATFAMMVNVVSERVRVFKDAQHATAWLTATQS